MGSGVSGRYGRCVLCHAELEREMVETTRFGDPAPTYVYGGWNGHRYDGCTGGPVETYVPRYVPPYRMVRTAPFVAVHFTESDQIQIAPVEMMVCHIGPPAPYPAVPTPEDLLREAGLSVRWL